MLKRILTTIGVLECEVPTQFSCTQVNPTMAVSIRVDGRWLNGTVTSAGTRAMTLRTERGTLYTIYAHGTHGEPRIGEYGHTEHEVTDVIAGGMKLW